MSITRASRYEDMPVHFTGDYDASGSHYPNPFDDHAQTHDTYTPSRRPSKRTSVVRGDEYGSPSSRATRYLGEDHNGSPYTSDSNRPGLYEDPPSESSAAKDDKRPPFWEDLEYSDPYDETRARPVAEKPSRFFTFLNGKYPIDQQIENKRRGIGRQRFPYLVWTLTAAMVAVFIAELVVNYRAQGTPISFKPVVNPMLGPSSSALINMGARFPLCMKVVTGVPLTTQFPCLNDTANPPDQLCSLDDLCGFGGFHDENPNQWFRFITPIFLHAGIVHILLNMFAQLTVSAQMEREMGTPGFFVTYFAAGIFGNVLGGNFSLVGAPSVGASGAIFGTVAITWVDLVFHWRYKYRPVRTLIFMTIELIVGLALGYIPYVDNFVHIGGFFMGLLVGTSFYPVISTTKRRIWIVWIVRVLALPVTLVLFIVLIRNFYTSDPYAACSGCRYLSCFPTASNNHCQGTGLTSGGAAI